MHGRVDRLNRDLAAVKRQLFGSRRERFIADNGEDRAGEQGAVEQDGPEGELPTEELSAPALEYKRPRTSQGRRPRVIDASIPREKVFHRLNEQEVPAELWNDPRAKRFFRFVREEVELKPATVRVFEHYEEVIVLEDETRTECRMVAASAPPPLIETLSRGSRASRLPGGQPFRRSHSLLPGRGRFARMGFSIHRATQWRWMRALAAVLLPLVELIRQRVMASHVQGIDETPCDILCPELGRTRTLTCTPSTAIRRTRMCTSPFRAQTRRTSAASWGTTKATCSRMPTSATNSSPPLRKTASSRWDAGRQDTGNSSLIERYSAPRAAGEALRHRARRGWMD